VEKQHEFECGCVVEFDLIDFETGQVRFTFEIEYCEQHDTVEVFVGSDWLRFDLKVLPEEESET
jgi:hypothetical protein